MSRAFSWYDDEEDTEKIRELLEGLEFPPGIVRWRFNLGEDAAGDPGVWIWLYIDDAFVERKKLMGAMTPARQMIHDAFLAARIRRFAYIHATNEAEQRALGIDPS